ncbi:MAG: nucleotidyltransferase domain-containing protein, partial [Candidatus Goldiibacteriota bacterium]
KPFTEMTARQIFDDLKNTVSRPGIYLALKHLHSLNLIKQVQKGKINLFTVNDESPIVKQYKIMNTILGLNNLTEKIKFDTKRIVLYGSSSRGEDTWESDIDLFIYTTEKEKVRKTVKEYKTHKKIQAVIIDVQEMSRMQDSDKEYLNEVERGITLWEENG